MNEYEHMRKYGEEKAREHMQELGVDPTRIFEVSDKIRDIMDTGNANEIGFLQAMLDAALTVIPFAYGKAKENEKGHDDNDDEPPHNNLGFKLDV